MLNSIFTGIFDSAATTVIEPSTFILCMVVSLVLGFCMALAYMYKSSYTQSFVVTLALLPAIVCAVIMMVNGNVGAGVAVAGAFSLVRFRSVAGSAKEIGSIFLAMTTGLLTGMGYLGYAVLFTLIVELACMTYTLSSFGKKKGCEKSLRITIPEDLDYDHVFDEIFEEYTNSCKVEQVKTTNMGSMFRLTYTVLLKDPGKEKEFIDKLRVRNGNLEIMISDRATLLPEL
ncbi:MAG: DUF4956 domain-containing protein [Lachnospiraceae bacterium]|nr:DUF4956 domain-containing protein [Lachnospiraceae bacterium]